MHPAHFAKSDPDKVALIASGTGEQLTYGQLDRLANQAAHLYRKMGLVRGDTIAILAENCLDYYVAWWGAQRSGLYFNGLAPDATAAELAYVLRDCAAGVLILSADVGEAARELVRDRHASIPTVRAIFALDAGFPGAEAWRNTLAGMPSIPIADPCGGAVQPYSSGATGVPKGLRHPLPSRAYDALDSISELRIRSFGYSRESVFLTCGPLSHSLTLSFSSLAHRVGGVVIVMSRFEPATFLALVESHRVTISQMVPRMFVRLLKMPESERDRFDVSSLQTIVHSAAPCPPMIKRAMIDWWGPILYEFYSGSEGFGGTFISSAEWLERPGSVGKPAWGRPHICDEAGREQDFGATGIIYFEGASEVEVLNDPARSQQARHPDHPGWATFGDVGRMDADGYVYLIDRAAFVIRSGGHLIHPQDIEDELIAHPRVCDAAVFGVPDPASGERVKALVQPLDWAEAGPDLADALLDHCRTTLGPLNCPATIAFEAKLPRGVNGKLYKKVLIDREKQSS